MAAKSHKVLIKKLKKQVRVLQRKEEQTRNKLGGALKKIRKLGRTYKSKLAGKIRLLKGKVAEVQASTYAKAAGDVEQQMLKSVEAKAKSLRSAIAKIEKKHMAKLAKSIAKKGKKVGKVKKARKGAKAMPVKMKKGRRRSRRR